MRSVKIIFNGSFWDSQIYSGALLLLDFNGIFHEIAWEEIIHDLADKLGNNSTAIRVAFSDGELFYNNKVLKILHDPAIEPIIINQLKELASKNIIEELSFLESYSVKKDYPLEGLPTDTEIYHNHIYLGDDSGLYSLSRNFSKRKLNPVKHHDSNIMQIKASTSLSSLATASGADGLFEFNLDKKSSYKLSNVSNLSMLPCNSCEWSFQSIIGTSLNSSFFIMFDRRQKENLETRRIRKIIQSGSIFNDNSENSFFWGGREKFYRIKKEYIKVSDYNPKSENQDNPFIDKGSVDIKHEYKGISSIDILATGVAPFGTVLEFNDKLIVIRSDGDYEIYEGELVHWRIFPRSEHYSNQLHLIYEDRIEIVSFIHDYFIDQSKKKFGFEI